ncbi:MCE family protein [Deferribacter autotrophicus]|uniref:MCE family protein n=1 Tax=Deferribacter autotrophicus TaxID=500465 RepID=A0A5A8F855_9BACT|nr:MlaD family protein [Deferribacter autotrophicus]KAA0259418.1 MCE family protein [Deferribacter autotrophicus]
MAEKRFKNLELKVGLFIFTSFIIAVAIITFMAIQKNIFTKKIKVQVIADSGDGLVKGMSVVYSGFQIAKVDELYLRDDGKVVIKIKIPIRYAKWIKKDSVVKLSTKNFIGSAVLVFSGGSGEEITDNAVFELKRDKGVEQLIEEAKPILNDVKIVIKNLKEITTALNKMTPDWQKLSKGLGDVGKDLSDKKGAIGKLSRTDYLIDKIDSVFAKVDKLENQVNKILNKVENRIDDTKKTLDYTNNLLLNSNELVKNSNKLVLNVDDKLAKSEQLIVESGKLVKNLRLLSDNLSLYLDEVDFLLGNTNILLLNMQKRWPFTPPKREINNSQRLKLP